MSSAGLHGPVIESLAKSIHVTFPLAVPLLLVAFGVTWLLKQTPLRSTAHLSVPLDAELHTGRTRDAPLFAPTSPPRHLRAIPRSVCHPMLDPYFLGEGGRMSLPQLLHRTRRRRALAALCGAASLVAVSLGTNAAAFGGPPSTYAVFGDAPYGADHAQFNATPAFINTINADPQVEAALHVGDIHSGSENCSQAYDQAIADFWQGFADPMHYTPGDNEWADCQKAKQLPGLPSTYAKGDPIANLDLVRQLFFPQASLTLGQRKTAVVSQAVLYDRHFPTDAQYVENTIWFQSNVVFVTVNLPGGSNNDHDIWNSFTTGTTAETPAQHAEYTNRTAADLRWLDFAFTLAKASHAEGVLVAEQADMWDTEKNDPAVLTNYNPFVASIADHTRSFGGTVLLINGDTHTYRSDNPLVNNAPCVSEIASRCAADHDAYDLQPLPGFPGLGAAKFHRIVVHGSTSPMEWLKLTIDPSKNAPESASAVGPFSWSRQIQALP